MMWNYKDPYCFYFFLWISRYKAHIPLKAKVSVENLIIHNKLIEELLTGAHKLKLV